MITNSPCLCFLMVRRTFISVLCGFSVFSPVCPAMSLWLRGYTCACIQGLRLPKYGILSYSISWPNNEICHRFIPLWHPGFASARHPFRPQWCLSNLSTRSRLSQAPDTMWGFPQESILQLHRRPGWIQNGLCDADMIKISAHRRSSEELWANMRMSRRPGTHNKRPRIANTNKEIWESAGKI